jgi:ATP-dependent Clp protease protease subunit
MPGEAVAQWVDLYNRLYRDRILFLGSDLDDELANQLVGIMVYLNAEDSSQDIFLYVNSPGGSVSSGFAVFDTMQHVEAKVHTICVGIAASMASLVVAGGEKGYRLAFPHSRLMIHQPSGGGYGQASDVQIEAAEIMRLRNTVKKMYVHLTGNTRDEISRDLDRDTYFTATEALNYGKFGLIDRIAEETDLMKTTTIVSDSTNEISLDRNSIGLNWFQEKHQFDFPKTPLREPDKVR